MAGADRRFPPQKTPRKRGSTPPARVPGSLPPRGPGGPRGRPGCMTQSITNWSHLPAHIIEIVRKYWGQNG
eukprot:4715168-Pyramimonas_sp.AAC.1